MAEPRVVSGAYRGQLVESPVWDAASDCLWFVDVLNCVGRCDVKTTQTVQTWALENWVGCVALRERGGLLAAVAVNADHSGAALCALTLPQDAAAAECEHVASLPLEPSSSPNDGAVDAHGRLWVGSKTLLSHVAYSKDAAGVPSPDPGAPAPAGRLFSVEAGACVRRCDAAGAVTVSNGIGWSPDSSKMYYVDSPARCVLVFDYDVASGIASNKRLFADLSDIAANAVPDGLAVDVDGGVFVAMWDGGEVVRLSSSGELVRRIALPVSRPTSVAFGSGTALFITTCSFDAGDDGPLQEPLAGAIFCIDAGVAGVPVARCRI